MWQGPQTLLQGDNLSRLAEMAELLPASVRLCYLDPPFNTGENFAYYPDSRPSSIWLEELISRLVIVRELLAENGSVWLHLDDREQHYGRVALDQVFGREAFVATIVWQKRTSRDNRSAFSKSHDYIHVYSPFGAKRWKLERNGLPDKGPVRNPDNDPRGPWRSVPISTQSGHATPHQFYEIVSPTGFLHSPPRGRCWAYTKERFEQLDRDGQIYWPRNGDGIPRLKKFVSPLSTLVPDTLWLAADVGDNAEAKKEILRATGGATVFDTPKPIRLMNRIIEIGSDPGDVVLDPYLGSGTTAISAELLGRKWIGIERERKVIDEVIFPRFVSAGLRIPPLR